MWKGKGSLPSMEERAAETLCNKLTATPISHPHVPLDGRRWVKLGVKLSLWKRKWLDEEILISGFISHYSTMIWLVMNKTKLNWFPWVESGLCDVSLPIPWPMSHLLYFLSPIHLKRRMIEQFLWAPGIHPRSTQHSRSVDSLVQSMTVARIPIYVQTLCLKAVQSSEYFTYSKHEDAGARSLKYLLASCAMSNFVA